MRYKILSIFAIVFIFTCCNRYIDHFKIEGYWRIIKADDSSKGTVICISKKKDVYVGRIYKKNDNKYVKLLVDSNDVLFTSIYKLSKVQYKFVKTKIGATLLSDYGLSTEQEYSAMTDNADTLKLIRKDNYTHTPDIILVRYKYPYRAFTQ